MPVLLRVVLTIIITPLLLWMTMGVTLNLTLGVRAPEIALATWPDGAKANVTMVTAMLKAGKPSTATLSAAVAKLQIAIKREPANGDGPANLAALNDIRGNATGARQFFELSEKLSRRNMLAQIWLIEDAVRREQVAEAITHYNRALSVSTDLGPQLLPILTVAASDPEIRQSLMPVLARRPPWWEDYMKVLGETSASTDALDASARAVRLNVRKSKDSILAAGVLRRMVAIKAYRHAVLLAEAFEGRRSNTAELKAGGFDAYEGVAPFDWWLSDGGNVRAYRDSQPEGRSGTVLRIDISPGTSGGAAQQLVALAAGNYMFSGTIGDFEGGSAAELRVDLVCAEGTALSRFPLPSAGPQGRNFSFSFQVPEAGCDAQWVNVSGSSTNNLSAWLDTLRISI